MTTTTTCYVVDCQSGTFMEAEECRLVWLTDDEIERFSDEMGDSDRIGHALAHGVKILNR